jgi:hypothetical protein
MCIQYIIASLVKLILVLVSSLSIFGYTVVHLPRSILHDLHTWGRGADVYQKYLHVNLSLTHIRVGINTPCSSKKIVYQPTLIFHGLCEHKVCCDIYLVSPFVVQLRLLTCIIPNTVPLIIFVLYDLTTKVLEGNAEVGK